MLKLVCFSFLAVVLNSRPAHAVSPEEQRLLTGLGAAAPDVGILVNIIPGMTFENPAGVMYQAGPRVSVQVARSAGKNDTGFEGGYSGQSLGAAVGVYTPGCDGCKGRTAGILGGAIGKDFYLGGRYQTENSIATYGGGLLVNASGKHRVGAMFSYQNPPTPNSSVTAYTGGYAYVTKENTIAVELAGQKLEADPTSSKYMLFSLGYQKRVESLQASINYVRTLNTTADPVPESFWAGIGFNGESWHLGAYTNFKQPFMLVLSGFF